MRDRDLLTRTPPTFQRALIGGLICLAGLCVLAYVRGYVANRSLWNDEALLALNFVPRTRLLQPMLFTAAPIGFIALTSFSIASAGGASEHALRAWPLLAAILSLPAIYIVARRVVSTWAALFAVCLAGTAPSLVYYSSEFKPYSSDALISACLLGLAAFHLQTGRRSWTVAALCIACSVAVWASFPAIVIVAAVWLAVAVEMRKERPGPIALVIVAAMVSAASFVAAYGASKSLVADYSDLKEFFAGGFLPLPPRSLYDATLWVRRVLALFSDPFVGIGDAWAVSARVGLLVCALWIIGVLTLRKRNAALTILLTAPLLGVIATAALHLYPAEGRLLLFLLPVVAIGAAIGVEAIAGKDPATATCVAALLLALPILGLSQQLRTPAGFQEVRSAVVALTDQARRGDPVYVFYGAAPVFSYYQRRELLRDRDDLKVIVGTAHHDVPFEYVRDICDAADSKHTWVILAHPWTWHLDEREFILATLRHASAIVKSVEFEGAGLYLVDLSGREGMDVCRVAHHEP